MAGLIAALVFVVALVLGPEAFLGAEVPLAGEEGGVAGVFQGFGDGDLFERQAFQILGGEQFAILLREARERAGLVGLRAAEEVGVARACGILAGLNAGARRRAHRAGGIGAGETHAARGEGVEVRRLVERAAVTAEITLAEIVGEDEDEVERLVGGVGLGEAQEEEEQEEEQALTA